MTQTLDREIEILPGAWQVRQDLAPVLVGTYTVIHVLVGEKLLIVDTGLPNQEATVLALIERLGRQPSDVAAIVHTHGHGDHIGANVALRKATGAPVAIHRDDAFYLESSNQKWGDTPIATAPAERILSDGDAVEYGDHRLEVVHFPGHSPGSVGFYDRERRVMYCGDAFQGRGTVVQHLALYPDPDAYGLTLKRVREFAIDHLVPDHPYLPLTDSIVSGDGVQRFLDVSQTAFDEMEPRILDTLRAAGRPQTAEEAALPLCRANGFETITGMATITVRGHLQRMERNGQVTRLKDDAVVRWALT